MTLALVLWLATFAAFVAWFRSGRRDRAIYLTDLPWYPAQRDSRKWSGEVLMIEGGGIDSGRLRPGIMAAVRLSDGTQTSGKVELVGAVGRHKFVTIEGREGFMDAGGFV